MASVHFTQTTEDRLAALKVKTAELKMQLHRLQDELDALVPPITVLPSCPGYSDGWQFCWYIGAHHDITMFNPNSESEEEDTEPCDSRHLNAFMFEGPIELYVEAQGSWYTTIIGEPGEAITLRSFTRSVDDWMQHDFDGFRLRDLIHNHQYTYGIYGGLLPRTKNNGVFSWELKIQGFQQLMPLSAFLGMH